MTKKEQIQKLWNDVMFYGVWMLVIVIFCFTQANTLREFRKEQNKSIEWVEICVEPSC